MMYKFYHVNNECLHRYQILTPAIRNNNFLCFQHLDVLEHIGQDSDQLTAMKGSLRTWKKICFSRDPSVSRQSEPKRSWGTDLSREEYRFSLLKIRELESLK